MILSNKKGHSIEILIIVTFFLLCGSFLVTWLFGKVDFAKLITHPITLSLPSMFNQLSLGLGGILFTFLCIGSIFWLFSEFLLAFGVLVCIGVLYLILNILLGASILVLLAYTFIILGYLSILGIILASLGTVFVTLYHLIKKGHK